MDGGFLSHWHALGCFAMMHMLPITHYLDRGLIGTCITHVSFAPTVCSGSSR